MWTAAESSPHNLIDLVGATALVQDTVLLDRLYTPMATLLKSASEGGLHKVEPPRSARYVRIVLPGRNRTLRLAEVQFSAAATTWR